MRARIADGRRVPGLGHPVHKDQDPRTPRIYAIAEETGLLGRAPAAAAAGGRRPPRRERARRCRSTAPASRAPRWPTSASRAELLRGFALLARTAGLLGHLAEEMERPLGMPLYREVDERAAYEPPG